MHDTRRVFCNNCSQTTKHEPMRDYMEVIDENKSTLWLIIRCAGCESISFLEEHIVDEEDNLEEVLFNLYPPRQVKRAKLFADLPDKLDGIYRDTIQAFNAKISLFCAAGLRALVEGICADQQILDGPKRDHKTGNYVYRKDGSIARDKNLECKIEGLGEQKILTSRQVESLHEHRYLGNKALHELEPPDQSDLDDAIELIEHIMNELYNVTSRAQRLRTKRQK